MIEFIFSLPTWIGCSFAMVSTTVLGLMVYIFSYKLIEKSKNIKLKDPVNSLFRLVGILFSLMLSLAFGEVIVDRKTIIHAIDREAVAISDIYHNLNHYDSESTKEIQAVLVDYAQAVIEDDWPALAKDQLGQRASALTRQLTKMIMELKPMNSL
jgi:hypothetical protein